MLTAMAAVVGAQSCDLFAIVCVCVCVCVYLYVCLCGLLVRVLVSNPPSGHEFSLFVYQAELGHTLPHFRVSLSWSSVALDIFNGLEFVHACA